MLGPAPFDQLAVALAFGFAIVAMAYGIGPVSGCHINPAVSLAVFNLKGERVAVLVDGPLAPGPHAVAWRGVGDDDRPLPAGAYVCKLVHGGRVATRSLTLVK